MHRLQARPCARGCLRALATVALAFALAFAPVHAEAASSKDIVLAERTGQRGAPHVSRRDKTMTIEVCADTCDSFTARALRVEDEVWDVVFLHQAFFDATARSRSFRSRHAGHTSAVLARYARNCASYPQDATRAACIIKYLSRRNGINYAFVRYDRGQRCETPGELATSREPAGKAKCTAAKGAP